MSNSLKLTLQSIKHILSRKAEFPNWNENDPKSPSHIRGRFGGYMKLTEKVVLGETTFTTAEENGIFVAEVACSHDFSVFPNILVFNGVEYDVPDSFMTSGMIGTFGEYGPDYPFFIGFISGGFLVLTPNASTNTFSFLYRGEEPVVIDKKFLPPVLPTVTTADNGKFLRVSDGVWVAESIPNAEEASF